MTGATDAQRAAAGPQHGHASAADAHDSKELRYLTQNDAADIESIAALIIPTDETPGAREAGVIHFIDTALATFDQEKQTIYRAGLEQIRKEVATIDSKMQRVADLTPEQQMQLMTRIADSEFFGVIRTHTVMGFLGMQSRGGNKDNAGWKLIGFEDKFVFEPPFGYYDSELLRRGGSH
jgi:gluconate 2-dehydrogenase gamma chain